MFVISTAPTARVPASVQVLDAAGQPQPQHFAVELRRLTQPEWDALFARHKVSDVDVIGVSENLQANAQLLAEVVVGWDGVSDGVNPVAFDKGVLSQLLLGPDGPALSRGLFDAVSSLRYGMAAQKN